MFRTKKGFTMIELLVVLLIIGILAAVAAPMYLIHTEKAKASEAVGVMSLIRQAEREYFTVHGTYLAVTTGNIENDPNNTTAPGLGVLIGPSQYFGTAAYVVTTGNPTLKCGNTTGYDFLISATGNAGGSLVRNAGDVANYALEMDNSGQICYSTGTGWKSYK